MSITFDLPELALTVLAILSVIAGIAVAADRILTPKDPRERIVAFFATAFLMIGPSWLVHVLAS